MKPNVFFRRVFAIAALAALTVPIDVRAQQEDEAGPLDDPAPFEVPDVSEADFPFAPPADLADFVPIHQLELEEHPDGRTAAQRRRALRAVPRKSAIVPRATAIAGGARVLGWHPYWAGRGENGDADSSDHLSYNYSNLTHIAYFSAEVGTSGTIANLHDWNTDPVVETAHSNGVKVILTATLFGETSNHKLLTNSAACTKLITNLVAKTTARGGDGICIDFESVGSWSGATKALTSFMSNLVVKAHEANLEVSICLPSVDWYADFAVGEYEKIGVDYSIIMGYDYYYAGSATPGPVAPLRSSAQWIGSNSWCSVDYSTRYYLNKMTNAAHLMLAVPYYGRRWQAKSCALGAKTTNTSSSAAILYPNAVDSAETHGRRWDSNGSVPYTVWTNSSKYYQLFYDDAESLGLKYDYAKANGLGGVGIWCLTHAPESEELWDLLGTKLGDYTPPGVTIPSTASGPDAIATGVSSNSAVFSWIPATVDPAGYVIQSAPSAEGLDDGWWEPASGLFSNSFSSAEGWGSFTNKQSDSPTNVIVSGKTWVVYYSQLRASTESHSDLGYVYLSANASYIRTPPITDTITQVTARVRSANTNYLEYRKVTILASTNSGSTWTTLGNCPANNFTNILEYPFTCSLQSDSGVLLMVSNSTDKTIGGQTVILHELTAGLSTTNWVAAPGTTVTDSCATNLTGLAAPTYLRVRNASSTNWSDIVAVHPGMVPSGLSAVPGDDGTSIELSWTPAADAAAYQVDVSSGPYTNWATTCPAASLGTNEFRSGQDWCYTGTVSQKGSSQNLPYGPGYCSVNTNYLGHYLAGTADQALVSWDHPLYGATNAILTFSNCSWNAAEASCGKTVSVLRVYYRLDKGPWNFLGECMADSTNDKDWFPQSFQIPYLDGESLAVKITAPHAEYTRMASNPNSNYSIRGAGLKNVKLSFNGMQGRYCDANRPEGYPKTVTSPSDTVEGLLPTNHYFIRVQALTENTRSVWVETNAVTTDGVIPETPSGQITIIPEHTTWDFVSAEGWDACTNTFTGTTNVNGNVWDLTACRVYPASAASGDTGYVSLFDPSKFSHAIAPAFVGLVTQVTTIFRPSSVTSARSAALLASTDGGATFTTVTNYSFTEIKNYTNTLTFSPPLDGGDFGVIFCASNSGTVGTIHFRRLDIDGYTTTSSGGTGDEPGEGDESHETGIAEVYASQPSGALSGVVVYCSGGHGFTANDSNTGWTTGRGLNNGMVEDMGNLDQLNYFVRQAWKAGATVVPMRPVGYQTNEVVLDNTDTAFAAGKGVVAYGGSWENSSQNNYYHGKSGQVAYRYAYVSTTGTTAWASYRPDLPAAGEYPVYVWARYGSDRVPQLYRVHHAGGTTDVRVDHRQVGNGWVWIGNYFFAAGTNGCVNISNHAPGGTASSVVIADAVRFGNGMGDISRGSAGVSGYPRELEGSRYWVQRMVLDAVGLDDSIFDSTTTDQKDNVSAPNRMAIAMCRTNGWLRWHRIYLSFHSNASSSSGSRGTWGLGDSRLKSGAPAWYRAQTNLAAQIADITTDDMIVGAAQGFFPAWTTSKNVYCDTYGEIYNGGIYNVMDPTINEVGFHTSSADAAVLRSPAGREWLARSALKAAITHLHGWYDNSGVPLAFPPDRPDRVSAVNASEGAVTVSWAMPSRNDASGDLPTGFRIYTSPDGLAFGNPVSVSGSGTSSCTVTGLTAGATVYFRVCATNAGGESLDSPVAGVRVTGGGAAADVLVVDGFDRNDQTLTPSPYFASNLKTNVALVRPRMINSFDYVKEHGSAIAAAGRTFDSVDSSLVTASLLARYPKVVWCLGEESTENETFSHDEQQLVSTYLANGGCLFVSGSEIGYDLSEKGSATDKAFFTNCLHCTYVSDNADLSAAKGKTSTFLAGVSLAFNYTNALPDIYAANSPDVLAPADGAFAAAAYGNSAAGTKAAVVAFSNDTHRTVVMGFPFETITNATQRNTLMKNVLDFFDADASLPVWSGETNFYTGIGGEITLDLKSLVSGIPSPSITLVDSLDSNTGNPVTDADYDADAATFLFMPETVGTYTFTFRAENSQGAADRIITVTVGAAPSWQPVAGVLLDLDEVWTRNLYDLVSGSYPTIAPDEANTDADEYTCAFSPSGDLELHSSYPVTNVLAFTASNRYGTSSLVFTNVIRRLDTDSDGIPDWWAKEHFGGPTSCNANADPDGDDFTNYEEFKLGTDPTNAESFFALDAMVDDGTAYTLLYWPSATGVTYTLYFSTNLVLTNAGFGILSNDIPARPPENEFSLTPSNPATFFHLKANYPE